MYIYIMSCLYIDADNVSYKCIEDIFSHIKVEKLIVKKIYGDWSKPELKNWINIVIDYGLEPIQCFRIGKKQSTDIKLITDVTNDIYSNNNINHIYLVSSDIDFTHLCQLIRQKSIYLTILSLQESVLKNYANEFININNEDKLLLKLVDIMGNNYVMTFAKFKKEVKVKIKLDRKIDDVINDYNEVFMLTKKKNKYYIIYINDFIDYTKKNFIKDKHIIMEQYKTIFLILTFEELYDYLFLN
jgi:hypothetical protein